MSRRVTVVLNDTIFEKAREIQAQVIPKVSISISFSRIVNKMMNDGMNFNIEKYIKELNQN